MTISPNSSYFSLFFPFFLLFFRAFSDKTLDFFKCEKFICYLFIYYYFLSRREVVHYELTIDSLTMLVSSDHIFGSENEAAVDGQVVLLKVGARDDIYRIDHD